jgi:enoyl-CoA hydratase/carnithine racemase
MSSESVSFDVAGEVARITLTDPETHNAQTPSVWDAIGAFGAALDPEVRVVVVTGEGPSFSSGLDRALFTPAGRDGVSLLAIAQSTDARAFIKRAQQGFAWLADRDVLTVAAVRGHAIGAGFQLALACDLIVASETVSFAMREIVYGIVPDLGGTHPLVRRAGVHRALEMCITGRAITAGEALECGIANRVVPDQELEGSVEQLVGAVLAASPAATRELIGLIRGADERTLPEQRIAEQDAQLRVFASMAAEHGMSKGDNT